MNEKIITPDPRKARIEVKSQANIHCLLFKDPAKSLSNVFISAKNKRLCHAVEVLSAEVLSNY